jgi:receptor protein-tyrosine kinase
MGIIERALEKRAQQNSGKVSYTDNERAAETLLPPEIKSAMPVDGGKSNSNHNAPRENEIEIDIKRLSEKGMLVPDQARSQLKEEYRVIKRRILHTAFNQAGPMAENANLVMITSANPSEGKSFNAINLAMSIAHEQDRTVLLVDADVVKPSLTRTLGIQPKLGLVDYLLGNVEDIGDVICNTNIPGLKMIQAGRAHHLTSELLASDRMRALMSELASRYPDRLVLLDSPPLLGVTESHVLAQLTGQTVLVVAYGHTLKEDVQACIPLLNPDSAVGLLINRSQQRNKNKYGYGYYNR